MPLPSDEPFDPPFDRETAIHTLRMTTMDQVRSTLARFIEKPEAVETVAESLQRIVDQFGGSFHAIHDRARVRDLRRARERGAEGGSEQ